MRVTRERVRLAARLVSRAGVRCPPLASWPVRWLGLLAVLVASPRGLASLLVAPRPPGARLALRPPAAAARAPRHAAPAAPPALLRLRGAALNEGGFPGSSWVKITG